MRLVINIKIVDNRHWRATYMNSDYKVGDLIYDANIYDAMNTNLDDLHHKYLHHKLLLSAKTQKGINIPPEAL